MHEIENLRNDIRALQRKAAAMAQNLGVLADDIERVWANGGNGADNGQNGRIIAPEAIPEAEPTPTATSVLPAGNSPVAGTGRKYPPLPPEIQRQIVALHDQGMKVQEIATALGIDNPRRIGPVLMVDGQAKKAARQASATPAQAPQEPAVQQLSSQPLPPQPVSTARPQKAPAFADRVAQRLGMVEREPETEEFSVTSMANTLWGLAVEEKLDMAATMDLLNKIKAVPGAEEYGAQLNDNQLRLEISRCVENGTMHKKFASELLLRAGLKD